MNETSEIRIIFWGTPEFAIPAFEALFNNGYSVVAAVTNPDEPKGRKQILTPPPVKVFAQKHGIPVFQPNNLKIENWAESQSFGFRRAKPGNSPRGRILKIPEADLYIVAAYGKIIPKGIIELPKYGALNIHPSLLPRWRGPSPIQHAILAGDTETGVTIMLMDEKADHGPAIAASSLQLPASSRPTYRELHDELAKLGAKLLIETLPKWLKGKITPVPQDDAKATYSKILKKEDGRIDWERPAFAIERQIRAFREWPGSYTLWQKNDQRIRLEIEEVEVNDEAKVLSRPGLARQNEKGFLIIQAGQGGIRVLKLKHEGKKSLSAKEFLNGYKDIIGTTLE